MRSLPLPGPLIRREERLPLRKRLSPLFLFFAGRSPSIAPPVREYQVSLYQDDTRDPYGFGLRVVGTGPAAGQGQQQQQQQQQGESACARVLWIAPGGPAHRAGIKVGDRVSEPQNLR